MKNPPQDPTPPPDRIDVRHLLNAQTGRIGWPELQRHFARGRLLWVSPGLDLVEVAARVVEDDKTALDDWLASGEIARAGSDQARLWHARQSEFWAVVAAPWVLVQETSPTSAP